MFILLLDILIISHFNVTKETLMNKLFHCISLQADKVCDAPQLPSTLVTKKWNSKITELKVKFKTENSLSNVKNKKIKHIKRNENNYHILVLVRAFTLIQNWVLKLFLWLAKALTCKPVVNKVITLIAKWKQKNKKQIRYKTKTKDTY